MLARREYSRQELLLRLVRRGFDTAAVKTELDQLIAEGSLSEDRFVENFIRARRERGQGPRRIRGELIQRGISDELVDACIDDSAADWLPLARQAQMKRFGTAPTEWSERARQARFLRQRGFSEEQIRQCLENNEPD